MKARWIQFKTFMKKHKLKFLLFFVSTFAFSLMMFPYNDLADLVTSQIAKQSGGAVFVQFDDLSLGLVPSLGIKLSGVQIDTQTLPTIRAGALTLAPSIASLLALKPGFNFQASDFMGGDANLTFKVSNGKNDVQKGHIDFSFDDLNLKDVQKSFALPVSMEGSIDAETLISADPQLKEQPNGELKLKGNQLFFPAPTIPIEGFGAITLPDMKFSNLNVTAKLEESLMTLDQLNLGTEKDPLSIRLKGQIGVTFRLVRGRVVPNFSNYDLKVDIVAQKGLADQLMFLELLSDYKARTSGKDTQRYLVRMRGRNFYAPPNMTRITSF